MINIFSMEQKFSSLLMKKGAEKRLGPGHKSKGALPWSRPVVRCLFQCLMLKLYPTILKWVDKTENIFSILFKHKKSPDWTSKNLNFFKKLDSLSPKKQIKYANEKDPEQCCKRRCKANLRKLINDGIIEFIQTETINKCTKLHYYKFLEIPCDNDDDVKKKKSLGNDLAHEEIIVRNEDFSLLQENEVGYHDLNELMKLTYIDKGKGEDYKHLMNNNVLGIENNHELDEDFANMNTFTEDSNIQINHAKENCFLSAQDRIGNISPTSEIKCDGVTNLLGPSDKQLNGIELVPSKEYACYIYAVEECTHSMFAYDQGKHPGEKNNLIIADLDLPSFEESVDIGHLLTKMSDQGDGLNCLLTSPLLSSGAQMSYEEMELEDVAEKL